MKKLMISICSGALLFSATTCAMDSQALVPVERSARVVIVNEDAGQQRRMENQFELRIGQIAIRPRAGADAAVCGTMWLANLANRNGWFTCAWEGAKQVGASIKQTVRRYPVISGIMVAALAGATVTTMGYAHA